MGAIVVELVFLLAPLRRQERLDAHVGDGDGLARGGCRAELQAAALGLPGCLLGTSRERGPELLRARLGRRGRRICRRRRREVEAGRWRSLPRLGRELPAARRDVAAEEVPQRAFLGQVDFRRGGEPEDGVDLVVRRKEQCAAALQGDRVETIGAVDAVRPGFADGLAVRDAKRGVGNRPRTGGEPRRGVRNRRALRHERKRKQRHEDGFTSHRYVLLQIFNMLIIPKKRPSMREKNQRRFQTNFPVAESGQARMASTGPS